MGMKSVSTKIIVLFMVLCVALPAFSEDSLALDEAKIERPRLFDAVLGIESTMMHIANWEESAYPASVSEELYGDISQQTAFESYKKLADSGNVRAMIAVSLGFENGLGTKTNRKNALSYLEKAMEKQYAPAISRYCELTIADRSMTTTDAKIVVQLLANSLSSRYQDAYRVLSTCYRMGFGVKSDKKIAADLLEKSKLARGANAALADTLIAELYLEMYQDDNAKTDLVEKAHKLYSQAAELGSEDAMLSLATEFSNHSEAGFWYKKYKETVSNRVNEELAHKERMVFYWLSRAEKGDIYAQYDLADFYDARSVSKMPNLEKSIYYLKKAADGGNEKACFELYFMYLSGDGVKQDFSEAKKYRQKCGEYGGNMENDLRRIEAEKSFKSFGDKNAQTFNPKEYDANENPDSLYEGAVLFYLPDGNASVENWKAVFPYVEKAALNGNADALCLLGDIYFNGYGVDGDVQKGLHYYRIAAALLNEDAMLKIAECYEDGIAVPFDADEAMAWYMMAALRGNTAAQNFAAFYDELGLLSTDDVPSKSETVESEELWWTQPSESKSDEDENAIADISEEINWETFGEPTVVNFDNAPDFAYDVAVMESPESVALMLLSCKMLDLPNWSDYCTEVEAAGETQDGEESVESVWNEKISGSDDLVFKIYGNTFTETEDGGTLVFSVSGTAFGGSFSTDYALDFVHSEEDGYRVVQCREIDFAFAYYIYIGLLLNSMAE